MTVKQLREQLMKFEGRRWDDYPVVVAVGTTVYGQVLCQQVRYVEACQLVFSSDSTPSDIHRSVSDKGDESRGRTVIRIV